MPIIHIRKIVTQTNSMASFYKPHRHPNWNYGGPNWKLSRSKIDLFLNCPRCFYIDNVLGSARVPGFPFNLNSAVDALFKKEFDIHRKAKTPHPLMTKYGIDAIPYDNKDIDLWRENFKGIIVEHEPTGLTVSGAVDDVWVNPEGELIVVDYKSTSKDKKIDALDEEWQIGYKRQMEIYQWLLRQKGYKVSDTGYFVYANADTSKEAFNNVLDFDVTLIPYTGNADWVEPTLMQIKKCLDDPRVPKAGKECDYCTYRETIAEVLKKHSEKRQKDKDIHTQKDTANTTSKEKTTLF